MRTATLSALVLLILVQPVAAQVGARVGDRVRVFTSSGDRHTGTIAVITSSSLRLDDGTGLSVPLADVDRLQVSRGQQSRALRGLAVGTGLGVGLGAVVGALYYPTDDAGCPEFDGRGACVVGWSVVFGAVGLVVGVVTGALSKTDRWEDVAVGQFSFSLAPLGGDGLIMVTRVRF